MWPGLLIVKSVLGGESERLEFSFEGEDEGDPRTGRGWAILENQKLTGRFYFHMGDDSSFVAVKK